MKEKPFQSASKPNRVQRKGIIYEAKVQQWFERTFGFAYFPSPWFIYCDGDVTRYCQPDGLLVDEGRKQITIVEVKYSHTSDAYWQMQNLYVPVVACWLRGQNWKIATLEVVKWFDAAVKCPVLPRMRSSVVNVVPGEFAVHILTLK